MSSWPKNPGDQIMPRHTTRRHFLQTAGTAGAALGLGEWAKLLPLSPATGDETKVPPDPVRFSPDIDPVVRLIEEEINGARLPFLKLVRSQKNLSS